MNLTVSNGGIVYLLYSDKISPFFYIIFSFYPPFNFAKVFIDIASKTLPEYDSALRRFVSGPGYSFTDLFVGKNSYDYVPASWIGVGLLFLDGLFFLILYWYCDNVISDGNGIRKSPIFFLYPSYWGIQCFRSKEHKAPSDDNITFSKFETDDVKVEFKRARDWSQPAIVRIISLRKTFSGFFSRIAHKILPQKFADKFSEKKALKELNLVVRDNECVSLLGHNGAGKSTTMNILTGLFEQSHGEAYVSDLDVKTSISAVRKQLGICPQHDILWDDLTAEEHLELFGDLKGIPRKECKEQVKSLLDSVELSKVGHHLTKTYSGGMKRRLSICIACIGNPKLILLDEPTTGLVSSTSSSIINLPTLSEIGSLFKKESLELDSQHEKRKSHDFDNTCHG